MSLPTGYSSTGYPTYNQTGYGCLGYPTSGTFGSAYGSDLGVYGLGSTSVTSGVTSSSLVTSASTAVTSQATSSASSVFGDSLGLKNDAR